VSKNVAVFVDVANIFYAAKAAGVDIDYVTLLKSATAGRDFIRAYAYTGLDPENENQRQFQAFLARNGYKVVSKDIRKYGDGKVKANLDIELVVDLMKTARNVDIAVVVSGDGDFAPAIRAVQEMGTRVEVISFRGNTSSDLIDVADQFTDITQLAKVERTGRSGRRVAASGEDLSMTAVPDKETEGAPRRRGSRRTSRPTEEAAEAPQPAAATERTERTAASAERGTRVAARSAAEAIAAAGVPSLRVLPGERLSRAASGDGSGVDLEAEGADDGDVRDALALGAEGLDQIAASATTVEGDGEGVAAEPAAGDGETAQRDGEGRRRRRRRGGRGRGRGRGRDREFAPAVEPDDVGAEGDVEDAAAYGPVRAPQSTFGSIWDSQLGMATPSRPAADASPQSADDLEEDIEEPEIPEYLLAERRRGGGQGQFQGGHGGRGGRGGRGRSAYAAALDRERYGRSPGGSPTWSGDRGPRRDRGPRPGGRPYQGQGRPGGFERSGSAEPWSEVPPDLEEQIRAQLAVGRGPAVGASVERTTAPTPEVTAPPSAAEPRVVDEAEPGTAVRSRSGRGQRRTDRDDGDEAGLVGTGSAPRSTRGGTRGRRTTDAAEDATDATEAKPRRATATRRTATGATRRTTRSTKTDASPAASDGGDADASETPRRRARPRKNAEGSAGSSGESAEA